MPRCCHLCKHAEITDEDEHNRICEPCKPIGEEDNFVQVSECTECVFDTCYHHPEYDGPDIKYGTDNN